MTDHQITIDLLADGSAFVGPLRLTPPRGGFGQHAALTELKSIGIPLSAAVTFREQGRIVRTCELGHAMKNDIAREPRPATRRAA